MVQKPRLSRQQRVASCSVSSRALACSLVGRWVRQIDRWLLHVCSSACCAKDISSLSHQWKCHPLLHQLCTNPYITRVISRIFLVGIYILHFFAFQPIILRVRNHPQSAKRAYYLLNHRIERDERLSVVQPSRVLMLVLPLPLLIHPRFHPRSHPWALL